MTKPAAPASSPLEIVNSRVFDAPRAAVFDAFADPALLAQWWGPEGFSNTFQHFDFRVGGAWRFVMHGPDETEFHNVSEFLDIVPAEKIALVHLEPIHRFELTMTYTDASGGRTQLTWRMVFPRTPENERLERFLHGANEQNFDRLAAVLAKPRR